MMLSVDDLNNIELLKAQNEKLKEQNKSLQEENKNYRTCLQEIEDKIDIIMFNIDDSVCYYEGLKELQDYVFQTIAECEVNE